MGDLTEYKEPTMRIDLDDIERKALAATPGPWRRQDFHSSGHRNGIDDSDGGIVCTSYGHKRDKDFDFIAAVNPATVLELVRRLREAEEIEGVLIDALEQCRGRFAYYVQHHLDKGDIDKAAGNEFWAKVADDAIAKAQGLQPFQGHARQQETPIKFFCHSEDAGYNEFDTLAEAAACAESMLTDARSNANLDGEWSEEETSIRYGAVIGEAIEVKLEGGGYEYSISRPKSGD